MKATYYISIVLICCFSLASAQGLHFSQYYNAPLLVNPANAGFNPDFDYRVGGNYRNQWANVASTPYQTSSAWGDVQVLTGKLQDGWIGLGATLFKDQAGSGNLTSTKGYASVAYHQLLGTASLLSLGVNLGVVNKSIDASKLTFDNQWNGEFFNTSSPVDGGENFARNNISYFDMQIGLNYAWFVSETVYLNMGFSAMHINKPSESFFAPNSSVDATVPIRSTIFVNSSFKIKDLWILNPNIYFSKSGGNNETVLGMNANRNISEDGSKQLIMGLYYRYKDAFIPSVGYQLNDLKMTASYDVTASGLAGFNSSMGAYEFTIMKSGSFDRTHPIKCRSPKF